ncbi:hypothetical protein LTR62_002082 [Meristemomyces frigidus]|uniref:Uncharacterized protein n=1 Tax=Meristemomyces frigidus TaxID=1508187 RepID=A0AAN7TJX9_9PEZI|nr:hypothetical protein LTR62_002082 [Meristemomyces frigidus]
MDAWQATQSWLGFAAIAGGLGAYYYLSQQNPRQSSDAALAKRRSSIQDVRNKKLERETQPVAKKGAAKDAPKKRKAPKKEDTPPVKEPPQIVAPGPSSAKSEEQEEMNNKQFAEQMLNARKGANLSAPKDKQQRQRTVKQGSASDRAEASASPTQDGSEEEDNVPTAATTGDVSDMLEPVAKAPSTLRVTSSNQPEKQRAARQPKKEEEVESKKQRQNRQKKEQQRLEREAEEKERKVLEEKQRRAAREARGEPAKNGIAAKAPASSVWTGPKPAQQNGEASTNGPLDGPLLDTFDAESTESSNGGMGHSTAATSTTDAEPTEREFPSGRLSEDQQMAMAMKQSEDESGWTTVDVPKKKKGKKVGDEASDNSTPVDNVAPAVKPIQKAPAKAVVNSKPTGGFAALSFEGDDNEAASWDP